MLSKTFKTKAAHTAIAAALLGASYCGLKAVELLGQHDMERIQEEEWMPRIEATQNATISWFNTPDTSAIPASLKPCLAEQALDNRNAGTPAKAFNRDQALDCVTANELSAIRGEVLNPLGMILNFPVQIMGLLVFGFAGLSSLVGLAVNGGSALTQGVSDYRAQRQLRH